MRSYVLAAGIILPLLGSSPAFAQNNGGVRVEGTIGWDQIRYELEDDGVNLEGRQSGLTYGIAAGYDVPISTNMLAGVELGVSKSTIDFRRFDGVNAIGLDAGRDLEISGRLGTRVGSAALLYGKLGYTNWRVGEQISGTDFVNTRSTNLDGVRVGLGAEVSISPRTYLKSEYRYSNYQDDYARNDIVTGFGFRF